MQRVDDGITVLPFEIMSEYGQRLLSPSTPVFQLEEKLLYARVTVPPMEAVIVGALTDEDVSAIDIFALDVKEHMEGRLHSFDGFGQNVSERVVGT